MYCEPSVKIIGGSSLAAYRNLRICREAVLSPLPFPAAAAAATAGKTMKATLIDTENNESSASVAIPSSHNVQPSVGSVPLTRWINN
jgi:hypothetical protein